MSVHKKFQPIRSSRLAGYRQHIYIYTNFLFYYIDFQKFPIFVFISNTTSYHTMCSFYIVQGYPQNMRFQRQLQYVCLVRFLRVLDRHYSLILCG